MACHRCGRPRLSCVCGSPWQLGGGPAPPAPSPNLSMQQYQEALHSLLAGSAGAVWTVPAPVPRPALPTADTMGPIRAWRRWKIGADESLWSVSIGVRWHPGVPMRGAPTPHNTEGVYAAKARDYAFPLVADADTVLGEVGLWGRVIEHALGYRAEYAYPIRLVWSAPAPMPGFPRPPGARRRVQALADAYGIPLTVEDAP